MAEEEGARRRQAPDPRRAGHAGAARGDRARPARREHHGVLPAVQRGRRSRRRGQVIPAELTIYEDRSFTFITKQPPRRGADQAGRGRARRAPASRTARRSAASLGTSSGGSPSRRWSTSTPTTSSAAMLIIAGTARSMGVRGGERMSGQALYAALRSARRPRARVLAGRGDQGPQGASRTRSSTRPSRSRFRLGVDPRKADQLVRGTGLAAQRLGQVGPRGRVRPGSEGDARPRRPARTSSAARSSSSR